MSDLPKHPADPTNELASDNSAIDPRDFRNCARYIRHRRHHRHGDGRRRAPIWRNLQLLRLRYRLTNPPLVLWSLRHVLARTTRSSRTPAISPSTCSRRSPADTGMQFAKSSGLKVAGVSMDAGAWQCAGHLTGSVANFQCPAANLLWRRSHHLSGCRRSLFPTTARTAAVCARRPAALLPATAKRPREQIARKYRRVVLRLTAILFLSHL